MAVPRYLRLLLPCAIALLPGIAQSGEEPSDRIAPGRIAVVAARYAPEARNGANVQYEAVTTLEGAGAGAGLGALVGALMWAPFPDPAIKVLAPVTAAAGALIGALAGSVGGARKGMRWEHVRALRRPLEDVEATSLHEALARRLVDEGARLPHYEFAYVGAVGPASSSETPQYADLKSAGFHSVLEVAVARVGFEATTGDSPSAVFEMTSRIRVVPLDALPAEHAREFARRGEWRSVDAWASDRGSLWHSELDEAYAGLAREISATLLWPLSWE